MSGWRKIALRGGVAAMLGALAWVYGIALAAPAVGAFHDDGLYAVTAQALASGRGYRITSLPGEPAQTKYPFLFPALLAIVWRVFPQFPANVFCLKLVPFGCAMLWGVLSYRLLRNQTASARVALALAGLMAASPWVLFLATTLLSETLFAAMLTGASLLLGRVERGAMDTTTIVGAAAAASAAFLTRTAGVAVIGTGVLVLLIRSGWRRAGVFLLILAALAARWLAWQVSRPALAFETYYSAANYAGWNILWHFTPGEKMRILGRNLLSALLSPAALMGVPATTWGAVLAIVAGTLVVAGFIRRLRRQVRGTEILTLVYGALVVCWAWPPTRFLAPLLPLFLLYGYEGGLALCQALGRGVRATRCVLAALALAVILPGGWTLAGMAAIARETGAVIVPNTAYDDWREVTRLVRWLSQNTPPDAVLMGNLDPVFYLYTGRKSVRGFLVQPYRLHYDPHPEDWPLGTPADMMQTIDRERVGYLVCLPSLAFRESDALARLTDELVRSHPDRFRLLYRSRDTRYRVYRVALSVELPNDLRHPPNFPRPGKLLASN